MSDPTVSAVPAHILLPVQLDIETEGTQHLIDLTDRVSEVITNSRITQGSAHLHCPHTTCGLVLTEAENGHHDDLDAVLEELAPVSRDWAHDDKTRRFQNLVDDDRANGHAHIRALIATSPSMTLPIVDRRLALGTWQRLFLLELDGARSRRLLVSAWGVLDDNG